MFGLVKVDAELWMNTYTELEDLRDGLLNLCEVGPCSSHVRQNVANA